MIATGEYASFSPCPRCGMPLYEGQPHICVSNGSTLAFNIHGETGISKKLREKIAYYKANISTLESELNNIHRLILEEQNILAVLEELLAEYDKPSSSFTSS